MNVRYIDVRAGVLLGCFLAGCGTRATLPPTNKVLIGGRGSEAVTYFNANAGIVPGAGVNGRPLFGK